MGRRPKRAEYDINRLVIRRVILKRALENFNHQKGVVDTRDARVWHRNSMTDAGIFTGFSVDESRHDVVFVCGWTDE